MSLNASGRCLRAPMGASRARRTIQPVASAAVSTAIKPAAATPATFEVEGQRLAVPEDVAPLFTPIKLGDVQLSNRVAYAPLTRCRAIDNVINASAAEYYSQRTVQGGLLISEATNISEEARGVPNTPGIWSEQQVQAWKPVVKAVHDKAGVFFLQLWHTGRASDPEYQPGGGATVSSSAVPITNPSWMVYTTKKGWAPYESTPRALTKEDIKRVVGDYRRAARNAIDAGFDGVEVHAANGYLIDQFIKDSVNQRTDEYGGSIENRCRFALEVVAAVSEEIGAGRVGVRVSPFTVFNDAVDSTPYATHTYLAEKLSGRGLAYLHMVEPRVLGNADGENATDSLAPFRQAFRGTFISAGGFKRATAAAAVATGAADLVAFGREYLSTPDLHKRLILDAPFNAYDRDTFYTPDPVKGYTDYPFLEQAASSNESN